MPKNELSKVVSSSPVLSVRAEAILLQTYKAERQFLSMVQARNSQEATNLLLDIAYLDHFEYNSMNGYVLTLKGRRAAEKLLSEAETGSDGKLP